MRPSRPRTRVYRSRFVHNITKFVRTRASFYRRLVAGFSLLARPLAAPASRCPALAAAERPDRVCGCRRRSGPMFRRADATTPILVVAISPIVAVSNLYRDGGRLWRVRARRRKRPYNRQSLLRRVGKGSGPCTRPCVPTKQDEHRAQTQTGKQKKRNRQGFRERSRSCRKGGGGVVASGCRRTRQARSFGQPLVRSLRSAPGRNYVAPIFF